MPKLDAAFEELNSIPGTTPDLIDRPEGCLFAPRCEYAQEICKHAEPILVTRATGRKIACHVFGTADMEFTQKDKENGTIS